MLDDISLSVSNAIEDQPPLVRRKRRGGLIQEVEILGAIAGHNKPCQK